MIRKRSLISAGLASPAVGMRAKNSGELWICDSDRVVGNGYHGDDSG